MFTVVPDHACKLLRVTMAGHFSPEQAKAFLHETALARAALNLPLTEIGILIETPGNVAQSNDVLMRFVEIQRLLPIKPHVAIVMEGTLLAKQLRRVLEPGRSALFADVAAAERWLAGKLDASRAA